MPPLLADFTHARPCKPFCEKYLTLPVDRNLFVRWGKANSGNVYSAMLVHMFINILGR